jgi:hypothetical protein
MLQQTAVFASHWKNRSKHLLQQSDCELELVLGSTIKETAITVTARNL